MIQHLLGLADSLRHRARRRHSDPGNEMGRRGEDLAHRFLRKAGYTIVARNYRTRSGSGELDVIAWDGDTLVFVEVKSRSSEEFGAPDRAIGEEKRISIARAARDYARRADVAWNRVRFDVVNVILDAHPEITHIKDAFYS